MKKFIKNLIKDKIPLNTLNYDLNLDEKKHIMQGGIYSKYHSSISKLSLNELCILFRTDKGSMYENAVYDYNKKKYVKSLIVGHNYGKYYEKYNKKNIMSKYFIISLSRYRKIKISWRFTYFYSTSD